MMVAVMLMTTVKKGTVESNGDTEGIEPRLDTRPFLEEPRPL